MSRSDHPRLFRTPSQLVAAIICVALGIALFMLVDLTPEVEADFFFSTDDPQLRQSLRIEKEFGGAAQVFVAVRAPQLVSRTYLLRLRALTNDLAKLEGVADARSITHGPEDPAEIPKREPEEIFEDLYDSPLWTQLLVAPDGSASFIVLRLKSGDHQATVNGIDQVIARYDRDRFRIAVTGVPYVSEHIRERLTSDLRRFSIAAFCVFAALIAILFRSLAVLLGTMIAALTASFGTFLLRALFGMQTDILTPNLWTVAFVLTLSHVVYLAAEWRSKAREVGVEEAVKQSVRTIGPASAWSLAANLLGFVSLIFVEAKPLRQFGSPAEWRPFWRSPVPTFCSLRSYARRTLALRKPAGLEVGWSASYESSPGRCCCRNHIGDGSRTVRLAREHRSQPALLLRFGGSHPYRA